MTDIPDRQPLLPVRTALILLFAVLAAAVAGVLSLRSGTHAATALLTAGGSFAGTVVFLDRVIG